MSQIKKSTIVILCAVVLSAFIYYWYATQILGVKIDTDDSASVPLSGVTVPESRKLTAIKKYMATEDKEDTLQFVVTVDKEGVITDVLVLDAETKKVPEKKKAFNEGLVKIIKGQKMSDLGPVDKIGTSTYTTDAFNSVIDILKAQL
ncbi:MAG: FMN-binding protein [Candidatus Moranbacteria bacterium]|nr:FMN-binding protein [Candidatus Moranbacteria bacterium]MDD3965196.1 FMN-binding protein [Candidatus Moranbacteria bacterium]